MLEPIRVLVCARREVWEAPDTGARDQYMPLAGAGSTSGAVFGSGSGGNGTCGPRGGRWAGVVFCEVMGEGFPSLLGFEAIADVDRIFKGLRGSGVACGAATGAGVLEIGGERGLSDFGVLPEREGGRFEEDFGDSE
jgi:hypothetical protein